MKVLTQGIMLLCPTTLCKQNCVLQLSEVDMHIRFGTKFEISATI